MVSNIAEIVRQFKQNWTSQLEPQAIEHACREDAIPFCRAMLAGNGAAFEAEACGRLADIHGCAIS